MSDINNILNFYKSKWSDKVIQLIKPLKDLYGLDTFGYNRVAFNGNFFQATNLPLESEYYFTNQLYKTNLFILHPDNYKNGAFFPSACSNQEFHQDQSVMKDKFGLAADNILVITKKDKEGAHLFIFGSRLVPLTTFYSLGLNNLNILDKFCDFFLSEWKPYSIQMEQFMVNMPLLIGATRFNNKNLAEHYGMEQKRKKLFLKETSLIKDVSSEDPLSLQETHCLKHYIQGKSAKKIAEDMHLSKRTIEHYIVNIKTKLNCENRFELFQAAQTFNLLGSL